MDYLLFVFIAAYFVPGLIRSRNPIGIVGAIVLLIVGVPSLIVTIKNAYNYLKQRRW